MSDEAVPKHVQQLIDERIDSVAQLEIMLQLQANPARAWSPGELAQAMRIDRAMAKVQLDDLCARQLVNCGTVGQYRYWPATPELDAAARDLARAYTDRRVTVIGLIFSKPVDKLRTFADAFRLRKD